MFSIRKALARLSLVAMAFATMIVLMPSQADASYRVGNSNFWRYTVINDSTVLRLLGKDSIGYQAKGASGALTSSTAPFLTVEPWESPIIPDSVIFGCGLKTLKTTSDGGFHGDSAGAVVVLIGGVVFENTAQTLDTIWTRMDSATVLVTGSATEVAAGLEGYDEVGLAFIADDMPAPQMNCLKVLYFVELQAIAKTGADAANDSTEIPFAEIYFKVNTLGFEP